MKNVGLIAVVGIGAPLILVFGLLGFVFLGTNSTAAAEATCNPPGGDLGSYEIDPDDIPVENVGPWQGEQLLNAAWIIQAGMDMGLNSRDTTIGVMTAMGESGLHVLDYGDTAGPDSRGLFQQRDSWGPLEDRMDPYRSSELFFTALLEVADRESLPPTQVAHLVQINLDPLHYEPFWSDAVDVTEALLDADLELDGDSGNQKCNGPDSPAPGDGEWVVPADGTRSSPFGECGGDRGHCHQGVDIANGTCDGPLWAASDGVITATSYSGGGGGYVLIDHGDGLVTGYYHMWDSTTHVAVGDHVDAGTQVGLMGDAGNSFGCHLHYEVVVDGTRIDPEPFMEEHGAPIPLS